MKTLFFTMILLCTSTQSFTMLKTSQLTQLFFKTHHHTTAIKTPFSLLITARSINTRNIIDEQQKTIQLLRNEIAHLKKQEPRRSKALLEEDLLKIRARLRDSSIYPPYKHHDYPDVSNPHLANKKPSTCLEKNEKEITAIPRNNWQVFSENL